MYDKRCSKHSTSHLLEKNTNYRVTLEETNILIHKFFGQLISQITRISAATEIAHDVDETAIQGYSRSSVVVPTDAVYMTSY